MTKENRISEDEVDLLELAKAVWAGRSIIAKVSFAFAVLGLIIAFTSKIEYKASCKLLPEIQEAEASNLGSLGGLAGLAGVDLSNMMGSGGGLNPKLYPEIVNSLPFLLDLMSDTLFFEKRELRTTSFHYFRKIERPSLFGYLYKYTLGLPAIISGDRKTDLRGSNNSEFIRLSKKDWKIVEKFRDRISISMDEETSIVEISVEMPDAYASAELTRLLELKITEAATKYETNKAKQDLEFIEQAFADAKNKFGAIQLKLAKATDRNSNVNSATGEIEINKLQNEFDVSFEVYKGLASKVEQAKISLKEETPIFTILEPVRIPEEKSKPKRILTIIGFTFIGAFFSCIWQLLRFVVNEISKKAS